MPNELPMDPQMMGGQMPPQDPGAQQGPDQTAEFKASLDELMAKLQDKYGQFNAMKFQSENKIKAIQDDTIKQLMNILQDNGVDPGNEDSINQFLEEIKAEDEDMYLLLEKFIDIILNGIGTPADDNISTDQVTDLVGKMGGDNQEPSTEQPGGMSKLEPIDTSGAQPSGPEQFAGLAQQMP